MRVSPPDVSLVSDISNHRIACVEDSSELIEDDLGRGERSFLEVVVEELPHGQHAARPKMNTFRPCGALYNTLNTRQ